MDKQNIAKRIIEQKKLNGSNRKPKYATRKLSIGLVSCMLGYALLVSPSSAEAAELDSNNQAVVEEAAETKEEAIVNDENVVEEKEENIETPAEETVEGQVTEEKQTQEAPVEEKSSEEKAPQETSEEDKKEENASEFEMSEEAKPEAVAAEETRQPKDISNEVTNIQGSIEGLVNKDATTIKPIAQDQNLEGKDYDTQAEAILSFDVPNSTIEGDYVDITLSNNVNINGIVENVQPGQLDAFFGPEKIATASYDKANRTIRYTFTKEVESYGNVKVNTRFPLFIDKNVVTAPTSKQTIGVKVGDNAPIERTYTVDYHMDNIGGNDKYVSNGYSDITNVNREEGTYDQTIYINPLQKDQRGTKLTIENLPGNSGVIFDQEVLDNVKLYVVKDPSKLAM
ncbi:MAG: Ig-like domain-containing protein, partial [Anaerococcus hydrogenalis]|nr:Ig-like domain-containing protein [Anaerococcus hydrogenalis]